MKRVLKYTGIGIGGIILTAVTYFLVVYPPLMAANASKLMCSCVYVMGRSPESVVQKEFMIYPSYLQPVLRTVRIEFPDSNSVTAKIFWSTRKSIFRKGLGCTLLAERSEEEVWKQQPHLADKPRLNQDTIPWPMGNRASEELITGVDYQKIEEAINESFTETNPERPKNTLAVVVVYDGKIVHLWHIARPCCSDGRVSPGRQRDTGFTRWLLQIRDQNRLWRLPHHLSRTQQPCRRAIY